MSELMDPVTDATDAVDETDATDDDLATLLRRREHARPNRLTWVLLTLLVLMVGFVGGAFASQKWGGSSSTATGFPGLPEGMPAGFAVSGAGPGAAAQGMPAGMTIGTVKLVDGQRLYVTDASGATVIVTVPKTATVTSQTDVPLSDLATGDSVVVRGETADDGTVTATSVSEGALPVPSTQGEN
ncbi:MAG: hypothetical protein IPO93_09175 [Actinobacteria bacterium]|jgi:hypothetical protein|nr:hypothetical protein [Actinomycetota bacterium]